MERTLTEDQTMMRDALARYLAARGNDGRGETRDSTSANGARHPASPGWDPRTWADLTAQVGMLAAPFAELYGGLGGGVAENMVIIEELGQALLGEPYLCTVVIGGGILKKIGGPLAAQLIPAIIAGQASIAFAYAERRSRHNLAYVDTVARRNGSGYSLTGQKTAVYTAPSATHLVVTARTAGAVTDPHGVSLFLLDRDAMGLTRSDFITVDGTLASELDLREVPVDAANVIGEEGTALPLIEWVLDEATVALCGDALGVMQRLLSDTVEYAQERRQFGRALAQFQVLQHRMVDMYVELQQAISITSMAASALESPAPDRARAVSAAKWRVGKACRFVGQNAVQIHGGIGTTAELPLSRYFKRATAFENRFGSSGYHLQRYMSLMPAADAPQSR